MRDEFPTTSALLVYQGVTSCLLFLDLLVPPRAKVVPLATDLAMVACTGDEESELKYDEDDVADIVRCLFTTD